MKYSEFAENFSYDKATGIITRLKAPCNSVKVGQQAGCNFLRNGLLYRTIEFNGSQYYVHRLAFLAMTGEMPDGDIDHIDGDGLNNQWSNLRIVSHKQNMMNKQIYKTNRSGCPGVSWTNTWQKWVARINDKDGKRVSLGYYQRLEDAVAARRQAEKEHSYHANHGRKHGNMG
jgi:hypothetical protein